MKRLIVLVLTAALVLSFCACEASKTPETAKPAESQKTPETTAAAQPAESQKTPDTTAAAQPAEGLDMQAVQDEINSRTVDYFTPSETPTDYVKLTVKDFGEIVVRLRPDVAPLSVQNFKDLVARGYYNGTVFHRVYPNFMIQGGAGEEELDPIKGEFQANGVENPLLHVRGVISMARTSVMDSATSQFFLMHVDYPGLDGKYAAFGYIVAGLETVDKICEIPLGVNPYNGEKSVPQVDVVIASAEFVIPKK